MDEQQKTEKAREQVQAMTGFYIHLGVFVLVMEVLFVIDLLTSPGWWVQWVFLGWGLGVLAHGTAVFAHLPQAMRDWQARKVEHLKAKM